MTVGSSLSNFLKIVSSDNSSVILAALLFLLLLALFVFLLHFYSCSSCSHSAQEFSAAQRRRRRRRTVTRTTIITPIPLGGFYGGVSAAARSDDKGLDASVISSIPLFVYKDDDEKEEKDEECVICLGLWRSGRFWKKVENLRTWVSR